MNKLVSIIVPVYNVEKFLSSCIDSIINQTYQNLEVLLIDDGSTDKSSEICDKYAKEDNRIKVIHKKNEGVSEARNTGLRYANGDYIFFVDSDDYLDKNVIKELKESIAGYDIAKISYKLVAEQKRVKKVVSYNQVFLVEEFIKQIINDKIGGHSWGYLISKSIIKNIFFDNKTSCMEDTIFIIECLLNTNKVNVINTSYYNHIINENGITSSTNRIESNIKDYIYSTQQIIKILKYNNYSCIEKMNSKLIKLLEAEMAKLDSRKDIKRICKNKDIQIVINNFNINGIEKKYVIYYFGIKNKLYSLLYIYIKIRKILKNIKNRRVFE